MENKFQTKLFSISDTKLWNKINDNFSKEGGIYKIIATENEKPVPIQRLLEVDNDGILYIGKTNSFLERVIILKTASDPEYNSSNHEFGLRYKAHPLLKSKFPYDKLFVYLEKSDNPEKTESEELRMYYLKFGELPPLNRIGKTN